VPTSLEFTEEVAAATDHISEMAKGSIPRFEWEMHASLKAGINHLGIGRID
jgi:hypothetical protein